MDLNVLAIVHVCGSGSNGDVGWLLWFLVEPQVRFKVYLSVYCFETAIQLQQHLDLRQCSALLWAWWSHQMSCLWRWLYFCAFVSAVSHFLYEKRGWIVPKRGVPDHEKAGGKQKRETWRSFVQILAMSGPPGCLIRTYMHAAWSAFPQVIHDHEHEPLMSELTRLRVQLSLLLLQPSPPPPMWQVKEQQVHCEVSSLPYKCENIQMYVYFE